MQMKSIDHSLKYRKIASYALASIVLMLGGLFLSSQKAARADYLQGPEAKGTVDLDEPDRLYDEYNRVDFKKKNVAKIVRADAEVKGAHGGVETVVESGDWRLTLSSANKNYEAGSPVDVRAFVEYIGKNKQATLSTCDPIVGFYVAGSNGVYITQYGAKPEEEKDSEHLLKKGKSCEVRFALRDEDITNVERDMLVGSTPDGEALLMLPKGTYTVKAGITSETLSRKKIGSYAVLHFSVDEEGKVFTSGEELYRTLGTDEAVLIGTERDNEAFDIPSSVKCDGRVRRVTVIGDEGVMVTRTDYDDGSIFYEHYGMFAGKVFKSITVPDSVKLISSRAFSGAGEFEKVTISVKSLMIDEGAFAECSFSMPDGGLGTLEIKGEDITIGRGAFENNYLLQKLSVKASKNLVIGDRAFSGCYNLVKVSLPETTTRIGEMAFFECGADKKLTITIPASVDYIGDAVVNRAYLKLVSGNNAYVIENGLLLTADRTKLLRCVDKKAEAVTVPEGVTSIGTYAFEYCKLKILVLPESLKEIPDHMAYKAKKLKKVTFGSKTETIGAYAFAETRIKKLPKLSDLRSIGACAFLGCKRLSSVKFANGIEAIGDYAFYRCIELKELALPKTVSCVGNYISGGSGAKVSFKKGNESFTQEGGVVYNPGTREVVYLIPNSLEWVEDGDNVAFRIADGAEIISDAGFSSKVWSIIIPESVKSIDLSFLILITDPEEGGAVTFEGIEPPVFTNERNVQDPMFIISEIPKGADKEAFEKAFNQAANENQHMYINKD